MIKEWTIYKIVNPKGCIYIGVSSNFRKRINYYKNCDIPKQKLLQASLNKYGFESHDISIVEIFKSDIDYAHGKEMFWIRSFMSNESKYRMGVGLNLTDGGQGTVGYKASDEHRRRLSEIHKANPTRGMLGKRLSEESIEKMRQTIKLKRDALGIAPKTKPKKALRDENGRVIISDETRMKMSLAKKGKPAHNKGKPMPKHQREALRLANIGRSSWNKGMDYSHLSIEERKHKFGKHNIGNSYNKGRKHSKEFCELMSVSRIGKSNVVLRKPIIQYNAEGGELIAEYDSIKSASAATGISCWTIGDIAKGNRKTPPPFIFKYKEI